MMLATVMSMSASGSTMPWFLAPPIACMRLPWRAPVAYTDSAIAEEPTKLTALIRGCRKIASTVSLSPWSTLRMPGGRPASSISSPSRTGTDGSRSDGFRMNALPLAIAGPNIHIGIIAGKLNGVMPATTPRGWRIECTSIPGPAPTVDSPFSRCGMPQANSITSSPRWTSPRASPRTLPCSLDSSAASSSMWSSSRRAKRNITRARRCGLVAAHPGCAAAAVRTASSSSAAPAKATRAWTSPPLGPKTPPWRPLPEATWWPSMKCPMLRLLSVLPVGSVPAHDPCVRRVVAERPLPVRAGHDVEVIEVVAVRGADRVVAARYHHHVAVLHRDGFVERTVVGVHALESEALGRLQAVVIGFLELRLHARLGGVVLVRRVAGPVPAGGDHLHHQQAFRRFGFGKDVADVARVGAAAAHFTRHPCRVDQPRAAAAACRRAAYRELDRIERGHRVGHAGRN